MQRSVIVIGGGAAGALAALAARRSGAHVVLVRRSPGATALSSGTFDFAHGLDADGRPLSVGAAARLLARTRPDHPYARLGASLGDVLQEAARLLVDALAPLHVRGSTPEGRNLRLATPFGTTRRAAFAQGSIARGDLDTLPGSALVGLVGVEGSAVFDARATAEGLLRKGIACVPLAIAHPLPPAAELPDLARSLDSPSGRASFATRVRIAAAQARATHVLLPTAGTVDPDGLCDELVSSGLAGAAELCGLPPSVPGLRLERALQASLASAGVEVVAAEVARAVVSDARADRLVLADGRELSADAFVLATGRFVGGGVRGEAGLRETIFDLPVRAGGEPARGKPAAELLSREVTDAHAAMRAGVEVDAAMRPADGRGRALLENVFAAGAVVGGADAVADSSGLGVAAATGLVAGRGAAAA